MEKGIFIIVIMAIAPVVYPVDTSLIQIILFKVVHFVLQVNTAGTCPPLLLVLQLLLQLNC